MADYYLFFSATADLGSKEAADFFVSLCKACSVISERSLSPIDFCSKDKPKDVDALLEVKDVFYRDLLIELSAYGLFEFGLLQDKPGSVYLYNTGGLGNIELAAECLRVTMSQFDVDGCATISWAETCSRPIAGSFGGGVAVITKNIVFDKSTQEIADEYKKKHNLC